MLSTFGELILLLYAMPLLQAVHECMHVECTIV